MKGRTSSREMQPSGCREGHPGVTPPLGSECLVGEKPRAVGDLKQSVMNPAALGLTPIYLLTSGHFPSAIKSLMGKCSGRPPGFAKAGHSVSYGQISLAPDQRSLATIALREPLLGSWGAFLPNTRLFGRTKAVLPFRHSRIISTLATELLKIPAMGVSAILGSILSFPAPTMLPWRLPISTESRVSGSSCQNRSGARVSSF